MIEIDVPGLTRFSLEHLVLDLNGTICTDGRLIEGVAEKIGELKKMLSIHIVTADTHGKAQEIGDLVGLTIQRVTSGSEQSQKLKYVQSLGSIHTAAIGNGANDSLMLKESAVGICVAGREGASFQAISSCDVLMTDIISALEILIFPKRLIATLRR